MSTTLLVEIPDTELTPEQRHRLKRALGMVSRFVLNADVPVSIDHLAMPVDVTQQEAAPT